MSRIAVFLMGLGLGLVIAPIAIVSFTPAKRPATLVDVLAPDEVLWDLPGCPMELSLQDGSRWALPAWSEPLCRSTIIFTVKHNTTLR